MSLGEYVPLQQGLRHLVLDREMSLYILGEYVPLQQGLRHKNPFPLKAVCLSESMFHYNKD